MRSGVSCDIDIDTRLVIDYSIYDRIDLFRPVVQFSIAQMELYPSEPQGTCRECLVAFQASSELLSTDDCMALYICIKIPKS